MRLRENSPYMALKRGTPTINVLGSASVLGEFGPEAEENDDRDLLKRVGANELEVHCVGVVFVDQFKGEERNGEHGDESADAGTLLGGKDLPPPDGTVGQDYGQIERNNG
ncbi:hypothetical protein U1Q18_046223, partial [Sarracenia purpurea var. burkii]